jgi:aryl-alcohol dehydrogenase-like predicted oxidoreductase
MALSGVYEPADDAEAVATIHRAVDLGVRLVDTADFYGKGQRTPDSPWGHNEELVGRALKGRRDEVVLATKGGATWKPDGTQGPDGRPEYIRRAAEGSLARLGVDVIDLYYLHRVDPAVPIEDTVGAMGELVASGKVRCIGLSEASARTIRRAHATHPLSAVQSEYSLVTRDPEDQVLPTCRELGIGFVPFAALGRGLLTGTIRRPEDMAETDWRRTAAPRFQDGHLQRNLRLVDRLRVVADRIGADVPQVALAWLLHQGDDVVPLFGAVTPRAVETNVGAARLALSSDDLAEIEAIFPPNAAQGERYPRDWMKDVDMTDDDIEDNDEQTR